ncbi:MAG: hypothetical protein K2K70_09970 [Lachnospiraceae bacterium]|nr:hypothetical protein [Lachnospiraceae bacterium]
MSGPKTSRYTLTPEQRRILAEQREMDRRKAVASQNIQRNSKRLLQIGGMFSSEKQVSAELMKRIKNDGGFSQKINELEMLIASIAPVVAGTDNNDVPALERTAEVVSERAAKAEKMVRELSDIAAQNEVKLQAHLDAAIDQGFSTSFVEMKTTDSVSTGDVRDKMRVQLLQMKKNQILPVGLTEEISNAILGMEEIQDEVFLKNYLALTVSPLIKKCKRFLSEYEECHEEFEKLYCEYDALCELYCYTAQEYPCTSESVEFLKAEIQRMKKAAIEEDEQAYISECLDEVMEEMGYNVLGRREVTKKNGKHFQNRLYTYGEGTAVNVTCSSDGKVAMELGGLDDADRIPDDREASLLCDSMESFCDDFKEIEKRLLAKGVILAERISLLPPSAEYAQIINTSDYEIKGEAEKFKVKKQHRNAVQLKPRSEINGKV